MGQCNFSNKPPDHEDEDQIRGKSIDTSTDFVNLVDELFEEKQYSSVNLKKNNKWFSNQLMKKRTVKLKVCILGDSGVGKTCLMESYVNKRFFQTSPTIGADFLTKVVETRDSIVTLELWDTSGSEKFHSLGTPYFRGASFCLIVFDLTNQDSFLNVIDWKKRFLIETDVDEEDPKRKIFFPFVVVGNKSDEVTKREVSPEIIKDLCSSHSMKYVECSAKTNENVDLAFELLLGKRPKKKVVEKKKEIAFGGIKNFHTRVLEVKEHKEFVDFICKFD